MKRYAIPLAAVALAFLSWSQFPGHTWLQQDSQIYVPILEHLRDPGVLRNEILAQQTHVAFTLYDEAALALRRATGLGFREVLALQQLAARALGIWGLYLMAAALGLSPVPAFLVAAICSLGAIVAGPTVLTFEYEPTPRAFAVPLLFCAMGLAAHRRYLAAGVAGAAAFLYHAPTAIPFWAVFAAVLVVRRRAWGFVPLGVAAVVLGMAAWTQGGGGEARTFLERLTPFEEQLQRMRASYVWISMWHRAWIVHYLLLAAIVLAAWARVRRHAPLELWMFLVGLPLLGLATMPFSWLLLEQWKWALVPQFQPMRALLFVTIAVQFLTAAAGVWAALGRRPWEAVAWFVAAYLLPLQPVITEPFAWRRTAVVLALGAATAITLWRWPRWSPAAALAAYFAIPALGGIVNYPHLHTPEVAQLSAWARASTPRDAVFLFPDAGRALDPGIFRAEALRSVYADWKGGGQVNYLKGFGEQWWFRWQQTMAGGFRPADLPKYEALGIQYVVLRPRHHLPRPAAFENAGYVAYEVR